MNKASISIVGGGIIGLATAYKLLLRHPGIVVRVLEKEEGVGRHQSGNNSGVMHAGLYYKPGSLKARLAVAGIRQMTSFCIENGIPHEVCGKIVLATDEDELPRLRELMDRGLRNGLTGLRWLTREEIVEIEPSARGIAAVHVPEEGIVDYPRVCSTLKTRIEGLGGRVVTRAKVHAVREYERSQAVETAAGDFESTLLINCAGLHSDRVAEMAGAKSTVRIVPFRGEYYKLRADRESLVRNLIYPVPDPAFPFLGVHFTRQISGGVEAGPNAALAFAREGYRNSKVNVRDLAQAAFYPGLWRFIRRYPSVCAGGIGRTLSRKLFCKALQRLVPDIQPNDLVKGGAGIRAQAIASDGNLVSDFYFLERPGALHVLNAPSPGATASLAIGDEIVRKLESRLN